MVIETATQSLTGLITGKFWLQFWTPKSSASLTCREITLLRNEKNAESFRLLMRDKTIDMYVTCSADTASAASDQDKSLGPPAYRSNHKPISYRFRDKLYVAHCIESCHAESR